MRVVLAVFLLLGCAFADQWEEEDGVLVLNKDNFEKAVQTYNYLLVEFYATWCGHCKNLAPQYAKAAKDLADVKEVKLAKVDAPVEKELSEKYGIRGYPTLKFFRGDPATPTDYNGERQANGIVSWLKKKMSPPVEVVDTVKLHDAAVEENELVVFWIDKDVTSDDYKVFNTVATDLEVPFKQLTVPSLIEKYQSGDSKVVIVKKFDDNVVPYIGKMEKEELASFIKLHEIPFVTIFDDASAGKVFGSEIKRHIITFLHPEESYYEGYFEMLKLLGRKFYGTAHVVVIDVSQEKNDQILGFFSVSKSEVPTYRVVVIDDKIAKFKPTEPEFNIDAMSAFVEGTIDGTIKQYLKSQDVPEDWDAKPVKQVVGKNYKDVCLQKDKKVFVKFYAEWCGHCKQLAPIWDELGNEFKDDKDVVIAKMDATANEVEGVDVDHFPTLKFYPKGSNEPIDYEGGRTASDLRNFILTNGKPEEKVKEDASSEPKEEL